MRKSDSIVCLIAVLTIFFSASVAEASCTWSFNWYCDACAKIGGRTTGTHGGYATEAECDNARRSVAREVTTGTCSSSGRCDTPSPPAQTHSIQPGGVSGTPAIDHELEQRRRDEERRLEEAMAADRRAKAKADQEQKHHQFMGDKLDALKSLKGSDFDTGNPDNKTSPDSEPRLKTGTETLGVRYASKEPRFSKGSKFSAPVDLSNKDPAGPLILDSDATRELIPGGRLGAFINSQPWPAHIKGQVVIALIDLERGHPERAAATLKAASNAQPGDAFLRKAAAAAEQEARTRRIHFEPETMVKQLNRQAYAAYVAGWEELEKGNMNGAARLFGRALDETPNNAILQQLVTETEKRRTILSPQEQRQHDEHMERARDYAQGNAALRLGLNAAYWNNVLALNYLDEASKNLTGLDWEFMRITKQELADHTYSAPGSYWKYRYNNRADAMLDALEYGRGDWAASLRYLKHARQIQHNNKVVDDAYRELERLSKEPPPR